MKKIYTVIIVIVVSLFFISCSKDDEDFGFAPTSVSGKTIKVSGYNNYWAFTSNTNCELVFVSYMSSLYTINIIQKPTCTYKITGKNKASLKLKCKYRLTNSRFDWDDTYTYTYDLTLTFTESGMGTVSGSFNVIDFDHEKNKTTTDINVISDKEFTILDTEK